MLSMYIKRIENYIYSHLCETMDIHIVYMHVIQRAFNKQIT